jgi:hypothetical protein
LTLSDELPEDLAVSTPPPLTAGEKIDRRARVGLIASD